MRRSVLLLDASGYPGMIESLEQNFRLIRAYGRDPEGIIREHAHEIQAVISNLSPVRRPLIEALPNLEIIAVGGVGYDHVDVAAAHERSIAVTNTPGVLTDDTADAAMFLMLNVMRRAVEGDAYVRAGMWKQGALPLSTSLADKNIGIVGLGRIGSAIADRAKAFKMRVHYHGPHKKNVPYPYYHDILDMARDMDVMVLSCVGGDKTRGLVDYKVLEALGSAGYLINVARGSVVVEPDLVMALHNRVIAGAGLDVFTNEPHVPEELFALDNVVLTPHISASTVETRTKMGQIIIGNLLAHFGGQPLLTPVAA